MKSVLMIGQSNMAGRGFINEVPMICNERIQMLRNGKWQMMTEPINYDRPISGVSLAGSFAAMWCMENKEEQIVLIPCAEGGSSIDDWSIEKILFKNAIIQAKFAMQNSNLIAILWHQGENDSYNGNYKTYYEKLHTIFEALKNELNLDDVPFIIGGLGDYLGKIGFGFNCTEYDLVNKELLRYANDHNHVYFVTAQGLSANPDGIHLNAVSQRKFGVRYYYAYKNKKNVITPLKNEEKLLESCINIPYTQNEMKYLAMMDLTMGKCSYEEFITKMKNL